MRRNAVRIITMSALLPIAAALAQSPPPLTPPVVSIRPRIILTPPLISELKSMATAGDPKWVAVKVRADDFRTRGVAPIRRIVFATEASPTVITIDAAVPAAAVTRCVDFGLIGGNTGLWVPLSSNPAVPWDYISLKVLSTTTLAVYKGFGCAIATPLDSSTFGPYVGQNAALWSQLNDLDLPEHSKGYFGDLVAQKLLTLALAHHATRVGSGSTVYGDAAVALLDSLGTLGGDYGIRFTTGSGYPSRYYTTFMALAYDWFFDQMSDTLKAKLMKSLNGQFDQITKISGYCFVPPCGAGAGSALNEGMGPNNFWQSHTTAITLAALATYGSAVVGADERASEMYGFIKPEIDRHLVAAFRSPPNNSTSQAVGDGGYMIGRSPEGPAYGLDNIVNHLFFLMAAMQTATALDTSPSSVQYFTAKPWAQFLARSILYQVHPDGFGLNVDGTPFRGAGVIKREFPLILSHYLAGTNEGGWMQEFYHRIPETAPLFANSTWVKERPELALLFYRTRPRLDYTTTLPAYWAGLESDVIWRSSWGPNAIWAHFAPLMRWTQDHQFYRWGAFTMYRGADPVLPNMQFWESTQGVSLGEGPLIANGFADLANVLCVGLANAAYTSCGQMALAGWAPPPEIPVKQTADYSFTSRNLTAGYDVQDASRVPATRFLQYWHRAVATVRAGTDVAVTVVWDRVNSLNTTETKRIQWMMNTATSNSVATVAPGLVASNIVGGSTMFIKAVYPTTLNMTATTIKATCCVAPLPNMATRIDLTDTNQRLGLGLDALQVLYAAPTGTTLPPTGPPESIDSEHVAVLVQSPTRVLFVASKAMVPIGTYPNYRPKQLTSATFQANVGGNGRILIADLVPGNYQLKRNKTIVGTFPVDNSGLLYFVDSGSALYAVNKI